MQRYKRWGIYRGLFLIATGLACVWFESGGSDYLVDRTRPVRDAMLYGMAWGIVLMLGLRYTYQQQTRIVVRRTISGPDLDVVRIFVPPGVSPMWVVTANSIIDDVYGRNAPHVHFSPSRRDAVPTTWHQDKDDSSIRYTGLFSDDLPPKEEDTLV